MTFRVAVCAAFALFLVGCTPGTGIKETVVPCKGKVTNAGQPLTVSNPMVGWVQLIFTEEGPQQGQAALTFATKAEPDGQFTCAGRLGNGIPAGKYRIAVRQWDPYPQTDKLGGKFDEKNTKIVREVNGKNPIEIDVSKPEG